MHFFVDSSGAIALFLKQYFVAGCGTWVIFNRQPAADFSQATFVSQNWLLLSTLVSGKNGKADIPGVASGRFESCKKGCFGC